MATIPHLLTPVVTGPKQAASALHWAVVEMERRYSLFAKTQVRKIDDYNAIAEPGEKLPFIVIIIDELSDLMMVALGGCGRCFCVSPSVDGRQASI